MNMRIGDAVTEALASRIRAYGSAVIVGVFIGTALTTGIMTGIGGWFALNSELVSSVPGRLKGIIRETQDIIVNFQANNVLEKETNGKSGISGDNPGISQNNDEGGTNKSMQEDVLLLTDDVQKIFLHLDALQLQVHQLERKVDTLRR